MRRIVLQLELPTEDGETTIRILTNTSTRQLSACNAARMYRHRWRIEGMFQRLEAALQSELRSLGAPRAALLAFAVSVAACNVMALVQRAVAVEHPPEEPKPKPRSGYAPASVARRHVATARALAQGRITSTC